MFRTAGIFSGSSEFAARTNIAATSIMLESTPVPLEAYKTVAPESPQTMSEISYQYVL
jgi:hypothetical protein